MQGLELDGNGRIHLRPKGGDLQQVWAEQESWGASSEKATHAFLENLAITGARAAGNAGVPYVQPANLQLSASIWSRLLLLLLLTCC